MLEAQGTASPSFFCKQATTDAKFDTVKAQMALKATNTYLKLNHNESYVTVRAKSPAAGVGVADSSAKQNGV